MYALGEKVLVRGQLVKTNISPVAVEQMKQAIVNFGITTTSRKYELKEYELGRSKEGIVVGIRNVVDYREHLSEKSSLDGKPVAITKTIRKPVYLIATNLKGLIYAPINLVTSIREIDEFLKEEARLEILEDSGIHLDYEDIFETDDWDELLEEDL